MNPKQPLRRTLKPRDGGGAHVPIAAIAAVVGVLAVGGGVGYAWTINHKFDAAPQPQTAVAAVDPAPGIFSGVSAITHTAPAKKPIIHGATPAPQPSPTAAPTPGASPSTAPTVAPVSSTKPTVKHPTHHSKQLESSTLAFDPAAATQANVPSSVPSQYPLPTAPPATPIATAAPQATPIYQPAVVVEARFIAQIQPVYPEIAKQQGIQGTAIVLATVGPNGNVISESIGQSTGNRLLDGAALEAARASRFQAPEVDGHPATETYRIVYTFALNN